MDVVIVGAGVAGLATAVALAEAGLAPTLFEQMGPGGEAINVQGEMYPSHPFSGSAVAEGLIDDALGHDIDLQLEQVSSIRPDPDGRLRLSTDSGSRTADVVVLATGLRHPGLAADGVQARIGRGVSTCAACDGPMLAPGPVVVAGSSRHALWEAKTLAEQGAQVALVVPAQLVDCQLGRQLRDDPRVTLHVDAVVQSVDGDARIETVTVSQAGGQVTIAATGLVTADVAPRSALVADLIDCDPAGAVVVGADLQTSQPGLYAVGEVRSGFPGYIVGAISDGLTVAASILRVRPARIEVVQ